MQRRTFPFVKPVMFQPVTSYWGVSPTEKPWRVIFFRSDFVGKFEVVGRSTQWVDWFGNLLHLEITLRKPGFLHRWLLLIKTAKAKACLQLDIPFNHLCVASRCRHTPASFGSVWHPSNQKESHKHRGWEADCSTQSPSMRSIKKLKVFPRKLGRSCDATCVTLVKYRQCRVRDWNRYGMSKN